jgi:hypothetical protein
MMYLHATPDRDQAIVKALGTFVRDARDVTGEIANGPERGNKVHEASVPLRHACHTTTAAGCNPASANRHVRSLDRGRADRGASARPVLLASADGRRASRSRPERRVSRGHIFVGADDPARISEIGKVVAGDFLAWRPRR